MRTLKMFVALSVALSAFGCQYDSGGAVDTTKVVDSEKPVVSFNIENNILKVTSPNVVFSIAIKENVGVKSLDCWNQLDGNLPKPVLSGSGSNWTGAVTLGSEMAVFGCKAVDTSDNQSDVQFLTVLYTATGGIDNELPTVQFTTSNPSQASSPIFTLAGTAKDNIGVGEVMVTNMTGPQGSPPLLATLSSEGAINPSWTINLSLNSGLNMFQVVARDVNKKLSQAANFTVMYNTTAGDTAKPTIKITTATPTTSTTSQFVFYGTADDDKGVQTVSCNSLTPNIPSPLVSGTSSWVAVATLTAGTTAIFACTSRDAVGNQSEASFMSVTYNQSSTTDSQLPVVTINPPTTVTVTNPSFALTGTATDNVGVAEVLVTNLADQNPLPVRAYTMGAGTNLNWSINLNLQSGLNNIMVVAKDTSGSLSNPPQFAKITYTSGGGTQTDNIPPVVAITTPDRTPSNTQLFTVTGTVTDNSNRVNQVVVTNTQTNQPVLATISGTTWSAPVTLVNGDNRIEALATDGVGNVSQKASVTIVSSVDSERPTITLSGAVNGQLSVTATSSVFTFGGTAYDNKGVQQIVCSNLLNNGSSLSNLVGTTSWTAIVNLVNGTTIYTCIAKDAVGNQSDAVTVTVTYNQTNNGDPIPTVIVTTQNMMSVSTQNTTLQGSAWDNTGVSQVLVTNVTAQTAPVAATISGSGTNITWSAPVTLAATGQTMFSVVAKDVLGNTSAPVSVTLVYSSGGGQQPGGGISPTGYTFICDSGNSQGAACNVTVWWEHINTPHTSSVIYLTKEQACNHMPIDDNGEMVQGTTSAAAGRDSLRVYKDGVPLTVGGSLIPPPTTDRFIGYRDRAAWTKAMLGCN